MAPKKKAAAKPKEEPKAAAKAKEEPKAKAPALPKAKEEPSEAVLPKAKAKATPKDASPKAAAVKTEDEPPAKRAKTEAPSEQEQDAPKDSRPVLKESLAFHPTDCTLNVVPTGGGRVLMALTEGGMQYLIAGARANVGVKTGRYLYELRIVEALNPSEASGAMRSRAPAPRQVLRMGFSTAGSPLILGEGEEHVFFDSEGSFRHGKKKTAGVCQKFQRDQVIGVLLNLDPTSPNANTLSVFRDGARIAAPQKLPENLHGKVLFPHICFRNVTMQVMMAPEPTKPLPFKCRALPGAAQADVVVAPSGASKDGKYEVVMPVGLPDEGTFVWLDGFLEKNPHFVELSDRKILEWAMQSGVWRAKAVKSCNDKPEFNFGLPSMDDFSARRVIQSIASVMPRHYVVMEVKSNLLEEERKEILDRFRLPHFKKVAHVVVGEPSDDFKQAQLEKLLKAKQEKADIEWKAKRADEEKKKSILKRQQALQAMRKKAEEARKKAAEAAKKKAEAAKKKAEGGDAEEEEDAETKMEVDEVKEEEDEDKKDDMEDDKPPAVELTDEEKTMWFGPQEGRIPDLAEETFSLNFAKFSIPQKAEGFDEVRFEWSGEADSKTYLQEWRAERKKNSRVEDLKPGEWFQEWHKAWVKTFAEWQSKLKTWKLAHAQKEREAARKKKAEEEAKKKRKAAAKAAGELEEEDDDLDDMEDERPADPDTSAVENVMDVGEGVPLFKDFSTEDWALVQLRYELYTLQRAFTQDVLDEDRVGVPEAHFPFYYTKYFKKTIRPDHFNVKTVAEMTALVKDTAYWDEVSTILCTPMTDDLDDVSFFLRLAEDCRRDRQRRIDAGDETARLKFSPLALSGALSAATAKPAASSPKPATLAGRLAAVSPAKAASARPALGGTLAPKAFSARPTLPGSFAARPRGIAGSWGSKGAW